MASGFGGGIRKVTILVVVVAAAYSGWRWRSLASSRVQEWLGVDREAVVPAPEPSPSLADSVVERFQAFRRGVDGDQMALGGREITSVLRYSAPGLVPEGVGDPSVLLRAGRVVVRARVAIGDFPDLPDLGPVLGMLPDTVSVELQASLMPFQGQMAALVVQQVEASRIPLPRRMIPEILKGMGRVEHPGLPPEALTFPLPAGVASAYIHSDSLILSRNPQPPDSHG